MAKNYVDNLSEETRKGMNEKAAQGGYPHRAPAGYRNDTLNRTVVVDPDKAPFVRRMFEWYATGQFSLQDVRRRCIAEDFRGGWGNRPISKSQVELILKNPFYTGLFRWKNTLYEGTHEPIVTRELFDRVQGVFASRERKKGKRRKYDFAFGGLMSCGRCGCAVTAEVQKGRYVYYHCTNYHRDCDEGYYREETLAGQFEAVVRGVRLDEEVAAWVQEALRQSLRDETVFQRQQIASLTRQLEQVKRRLNQAYLDKVDGKISEEFWAEQSGAWQEEKARISATLARNLEADDRYLDDGVRILDLARWAPDLYGRQKSAEKRRLLGLLLSNCTLARGQIAPAYRQPFDILALMAAEAGKAKPAAFVGQPVSQVWGRFVLSNKQPGIFPRPAR